MSKSSVFLFCFTVLAAGSLRAQSVGATFGQVVQLGGTPSDVVLDEGRGRLYLVNTSASRVDIYDYNEKLVVGSYGVGLQPLAAAISMDGAYLYVTNNGSSTLSIVDLDTGNTLETITLPARPEGVEVGADGRVLISTQGTGVGNTNNTLLVFDRSQLQQNQVQPVQFPPPPPTPTGAPAVQARIITTFRGKLKRTPDGRFIVGLSTINNNTQTILYLYEVFSATILKSRTVTGQSTVLSMSPDGSKFMAGFTLYDTQTLQALAQQTPNNMPFLFAGSFNTLQNVGGSAFTADGETLYSAFNAAPFAQPATRPQASTLLISDPRNLVVRLGIKIPESIVAQMVVTSDGANAFGLSESGMIYLPMSTLYDYPILQPETTQVFLAVDECNRGIARAAVRINNLGKGRLTFSVPNLGAALVAQVSSGVAPSQVTFVMEPGRSGVVRQAGTNLYTGTATNTGVGINVNLASLEAINIPNTIRIYMNFRNADQRGQIFPLPTTPNGADGLRDLVLDPLRPRLYIANAGYNRVEVFDTEKQRFLEPIPVGQLPRQMAIATDSTTMYVANAGGESISIVDLELGKVVGEVEFPPIPRAGNANITAPFTLAYGLSGLQFIMNNGTQWKVIGNQATLRPASNLIPNTVPSPQSMLASPNYDFIMTLAGNGSAYLYNALIDSYTAQRQLFNNPIQSYYGTLAASADSSFFLANGLVLNSSLTVVGGVERPGTVQIGPPAGPNQPPTQTVVSGGERNIAAVASVDADSFVRLTTPVRQAINSVTRDDVRTTLERVNVRTRAESLLGVVPENPITSVFNTQRSNVPPRQMVVDSDGTAYALTISGLSVVSTQVAGNNTKPGITGGARGVVNSQDGTANFRPGSFITVSGTNLARPATADTLPAPSVLGGSCLVFNDVALPLLQTSPNQISAQIPDTLVRPGLNVVQVRSLATAQSSDPIVVTVQRPQ